MSTVNSDSKWMKMALALAIKARGMTSPNPMVGAIVVKNNKCVGKGYHHRAGENHAEINAINDAGEFANSADLYLTLEPCSTSGRTPPCTQTIIKAGIKRVFIGVLDPNPLHAGRAVAILEKHNIDVICPIREAECKELNEAFFYWITTKKPFILLKMAMTLDGKIATYNGNSKWITGTPARKYVQTLRTWADAILVGGETVRMDNPHLTVRTSQKVLKQPKKIILTKNKEQFLNKNLNIFVDSKNPPIFISTNKDSDWNEILLKLATQGITSILAEGGGEVAATLLNAGVVNKVEFFIAPKILGGKDSRMVVGGINPSSLDDAICLTQFKQRKIGDDILISGYLNRE